MNLLTQFKIFKKTPILPFLIAGQFVEAKVNRKARVARRIDRSRTVSLFFSLSVFLMCSIAYSHMQFVEQLFGMAPDGGSGSLEFLLLAIPIVWFGYLMFIRNYRGQTNN